MPMPAAIHSEETGVSEPLEGTDGSLHILPNNVAGATAYVNASVTADADAAVAAATGLRLMGFSVREVAGTPAVASFDIVNGATGAAGTDLAYVELAASSGENAWFGPDGLDAASGISIDFIAGACSVVIYHKTKV